MVLDAAKDSDYAIVKDSDYPYTGRESTCQSPVSDVNVVVDEVFTIAPKRPNDVKAALCEAPI